MELKDHPLVQQIGKNLNGPSIKDIIKGGPDRWKHVAAEAITKLPGGSFVKELVHTETGVTEAIKRAGLEPIRLEFQYADLPIAAIGCQLPAGSRDYSLLVPPSLEKDCPESPSFVSSGRYLLLAPTTSEEPNYFNNGFFIINPDGSTRRISYGGIEHFKGAIAIPFKSPDEITGQLILLSPQETQVVLKDAGIGKDRFPNGGILLGAPLYTELSSADRADINSAINACSANRYFHSYNSESSCYIETDSGTYFFNSFFRKNVSEAASAYLDKDILNSELSDKEKQMLTTPGAYRPDNVILSVLASFKAASEVSNGSNVRVVLAEQNYTGRIQFANYQRVENYLLNPAISLKLD